MARGVSAKKVVFGVVSAGVVIATLTCIGLCATVTCVPIGVRYGAWLDQCPAGDLRLGATVYASGLVRRSEGWVEVTPRLRFMNGAGVSAWPDERNATRGVSVDLELRDADGKAVSGFEILDTEHENTLRYRVSVPDIPDGDYVLHAAVHSAFETIEVDVPMPFYAPALAHVLTDRPLYKPGQEVLLRSVLFRRTDLSPLDGRPGKWRIFDPAGQEMLVEKDKAGPFGVADTSFPLDSQAMVGTWRATWESGAASDSVSFDVRPFRLPRLTVESRASKSWFAIGDAVAVEGVARYGSGAPVRNGKVKVSLSVSEGRWPMPLDWEDTLEAVTDTSGKYRVLVGQVPSDLLERAVLRAQVEVTEEAGETSSAVTNLVLSQYPIKVDAVTELGDGLVGGFNNRAYLRVTRPDGTALPGADVSVSNWWDPDAKIQTAKADEDAVAALQIDPGDPVTVIVEAPPYRPRPQVPSLPTITGARELSSGDFGLAERRALDDVIPALGGCSDVQIGSSTITAGVRVARSGSVTRVIAGSSPSEQCVEGVLRRVRLPAGDERTYQWTISLPDALRPSLTTTVETAGGALGTVDTALTEASLRARRCLPRESGVNGGAVVEAHWATDAGSSAIELSFGDASGSGLSAAAIGCVREELQRAKLSKPAEASGMGLAQFTLSVPQTGESIPQDQAITAYQLRVAAVVDGAKVGEAPLVLMPGQVPDLRIRATPSLAKVGETVEFEFIRGPNFYGELPKKLWVTEGSLSLAEMAIDPDTRKGTFVIPEKAEGFLTVEWSGQRGVVFVRSEHELKVSLETDKKEYRPGEMASLTVHTESGGAPTPAGVGLIGVDVALEQLAPLLGPQEYGRITVRATSDRPAFGAFDPKALLLGQVKGENAAKAAVLRVSQLPTDPAGDDALYASVTSLHDDADVLQRNFYRALEAVSSDVAAWESSAAAADRMTPERMVSMWGAALDRLSNAGDPAVDAFGRELTLAVLPSELLTQVDPREVVIDKTRLPEDVMDWQRYIETEVR